MPSNFVTSCIHARQVEYAQGYVKVLQTQAPTKPHQIAQQSQA